MTLGQGYSTLAWIPEAQGRWALPLLHERITRAASPLEQAAKHLRQGCQQLTPRPLSLGDASDGCAPLLKQTTDLACAKLLRLRSHRVLYGAPPADAGTGRPRCHGAKFKLNEATTWGPPAADIEGEAAKLGRLRLRLGRTLQLRPAALHPLTLIQVERLHATASVPPKPLGLIWVGQAPPLLPTVWQPSWRRFASNHWYRLAVRECPLGLEQRLHWTLPQLTTPAQAACGSDLMPLLTWQLGLARLEVHDAPLPWQKATPDWSPGRTANAFAAVLALMGTPAPPPKPRAKSPGWTPGQPRSRRWRDPTVSKRFIKPKPTTQKSAERTSLLCFASAAQSLQGLGQ